MDGLVTPWPYASLTEVCKRLEMYETSAWAVDAILRCELLTPRVIDPCCGRGVLVAGAERFGYTVAGFDVQDWLPQRPLRPHQKRDWLAMTFDEIEQFASPAFSVLMNPPFSKAVEFVEQAFALGAYKVVVFQRFNWWEAETRADFWRRYKPQRIYVCRSRATCWRLDVPPEKRGNGSPTAHAWFVFERGQPPGPLIWHVNKQPGMGDWWDENEVDPYGAWQSRTA